MTDINIVFSRFSAFYSPLIATFAAGFLAEEGLDARHSVATPEAPAPTRLAAGTAQVAQSAVSNNWGVIEAGGTPAIVHFAHINQRDGFFLCGRTAEPAFDWQSLAGRSVLVDHRPQPLAMFRYAVHRSGLDFAAIATLDEGPPDAMVAAFRAGRGDYVHLQGPAPQQLEAEGADHVVASVGEAIGPVAFSSLAATRAWLETDAAAAFMRAYGKARAYVATAPAGEVADREAAFFPGIDRAALTSCIAAYQRLGNWGGPLAIGRDLYDVALDVFMHAGKITRRHPYDDVVVAPPAA